MLGELNQKARVSEREHRQRAREAISESILEGGLEIKKDKLLPVAVGDINAINEVLPTPRKSNWRQYIPSWGTPKQVPTSTPYAPQTNVLPKNTTPHQPV